MGNLNIKAVNITKLDCSQLMSPSLPMSTGLPDHGALYSEKSPARNFENQFFLKIKKKNFFSWPYYVASGTLVLWPGLNPHPLHWESVVFTAGPPGKS